MEKNYKAITTGLLIDFNGISDLQAARLFSDFCEVTCSNLFAFSPYQLHLEREEFLHFQFLADELKELIEHADVSVEELDAKCSRLKDVYHGMMNSCWQAFVCNPNIEDEPGRFIILQMMAVSNYEKKQYK